jgi:hypothetical protein
LSSSLLLARRLHVACAVIAAMLVAAVLAAPSSALAQHQHRPRLEIVRPYRSKVAGTITFSVRGIAFGARRIVFTIDGRPVWSVGERSARYRRATLINTKRLRNGKHVLGLRVVYAHHRTASVRKTIEVVNRAPSRASVARKTGSSSLAHQASTPTVGTGPSTPPVDVLAPPTGGVQGPSVANFNRETYQYSTTWPQSEEAGRYQFIVLSGPDYRLVPQLKAINPNLKILLYQSPLHTRANDPSYMLTATGCTAYADDIANHPSWILHDQNGNLVNSQGQTQEYLMDVGNPAYQQACAANAAAAAKRYGFDGIFFDAITGNVEDSMNPGITTPEYPTGSSWVAAMTSLVSYLGPAMRAQGLLSIGNVALAPSTAVWEQWVGQLDGVEEESWTDAGYGLAQQIPWWSQKLAEASWAAANGKYEILHSYQPGEAANTYGLAAMLLATNGRASYSTSNTDYTSDENWFPEYDTAQQLGAPAGPYTVLSNGVYERVFAKGIVLVNPTGNSIPTFSLGGGSYSGSGLGGVQSVSLGATSGLILLKTG